MLSEQRKAEREADVIDAYIARLLRMIGERGREPRARRVVEQLIETKGKDRALAIMRRRLRADHARRVLAETRRSPI